MNILRSSISRALAASLLLVACSSEVLTGPPALRPGRDMCGECGMLVSEERHAAALLVDDQGLRSHLVYDDIGCMLDAEAEGLDGKAVLERHVRDLGTGTWIRAESAAFLVTEPDRLPTPMGSGIGAWSSPAAATAAVQQHGGRVLDLAQLRVARREWLDRRLRRPGGNE